MSTDLGTTPAARTPRLVVAILVVAIIATPVLAFPYVLLDRSASRIDVQTDLAWILLVIHVPSAAHGDDPRRAAVRAADPGATAGAPRDRPDLPRRRHAGVHGDRHPARAVHPGRQHHPVRRTRPGDCCGPWSR